MYIVLGSHRKPIKVSGITGFLFTLFLLCLLTPPNSAKSTTNK